MYADLKNVVLRKTRLKFFDVIIYEYKNKLPLIDNACGIELSFSTDTKLFSLFSV